MSMFNPGQTPEDEDRKEGATVQTVPPVTRSQEAFVAEEAGRSEESVVKETNEDGLTAVTTHKRPGTIVMYKPSERSGWLPRTVSRHSIGPNLVHGWKEVCGDCGYRHINTEGVESTDPNLCSARPPVAVRVCPVCEKRIYDNVTTGPDTDQDGAEDKNVITDNPYEKSTAETRTMAGMNEHMWLRHARQAEAMGVPLPASIREEVKAMQSV